MIITFDGNVFVGKTSLIKALALLYPAVAIDEQGAFLKLGIPSHSITTKEMAISLQSRYLDAEERRYAQSGEGETHLLDRSFISMAAHVFALDYVSGIDISGWFLHELKVRMETERILIPNIFCFVRCDHKIIKKRALENSSRNTDPVYYGNKYLGAIEYFNQAWSDKIDGIVVDTETMLPIRLAKTLIPQISISGQGRFSTQQICDYLRDIFAQISMIERK